MSETSSQSDAVRLVKTKSPGIYTKGNRYVVVYRDPSGRQRKRFARTLAEARTLKSSLATDVARGEFSALSKVTFAEYAPQWLSSYRGRTRRGIRAETLTAYARELGYVQATDGSWGPIDPPCGAVKFFGSRPLTQIEPTDVKRYAAEVERRGVKANTVRLAVAPLKALLATAVEDRLIRWNPSAGLRLTNVATDTGEDGEETRAKALTPAELSALLAAVPEDWQLLVRLLALTGLRISEALALTWADLDLGRRELKVRRRLVGGKLAPPKSRFARRTVPLSPRLARDLWSLRKQVGRESAEGSPVFQRASGLALDRYRVFKVVKEAATRAGVPWAGVHTLRHTCATTLFRAGFNAKQVQAWLGHHSASFTLDTYIHLLDDELPDVTFLDALIAPAGATSEATRPTENGRDAIPDTEPGIPALAASS